MIGDEVVMCRNHPAQHLASGEPFAVDNGMRGRSSPPSPDAMTVRITSGEEVVLDRRYLDHGWVDHAYAVTVHKAQGVTCDHVFVVGPAGLYREGAYVALSRARHQARLYVTSAQAAGTRRTPPRRHPPSHRARPRPRSRAPRPTPRVSSQEPRHRRRPRRTTGRRARRHHRRRPSCCAGARHAADAERNCGVDNPAVQRAAARAAVATRTHLDVGRRVRAIDRDNVGHVLAIDDTAGTCTVHFESVEGRTAIRTLDWADLVVIDHPDPVDLTPAAADTLARRALAVEDAEQHWAAALARSRRHAR